MSPNEIDTLSIMVNSNLLKELDQELILIKMCSEHEKADHKMESAKYEALKMLVLLSREIESGVLKILDNELEYEALIDNLNKTISLMKGSEKESG